MNKERLLKLADFLEMIPEEKFNYRSWANSYFDEKIIDHMSTTEASCGTTACAFGWATAIPEFRDLGLIIGRLNSGDPLHVCMKDDKTNDDFWTRVCRAAYTVFDLSEAETTYIFTPGDYEADYDEDEVLGYYGDDLDNPLPGLPGRPYPTASAKDVAAHIRQFVEAS